MTAELFFTGGSPFARIARILIHEWDLPVTLTDIGFPPKTEFFDVSPMGQVPALRDGGHVVFPTLPVIEALSAMAGRAGDFDRQVLTVILQMTDALVSARYQDWAGLSVTGENRLGFNPRDRNLERAARTLNWLDARIDPDAEGIAEIALACTLLWADSRGPVAYQRHENITRMVKQLAARPAFTATEPPEWTI